MNLLDENFPEDQLPLLVAWHIPFRQVGRDVAAFGVKDDNIIPLLHRLRHVTFFTQDQGFFQRELGHSIYCLACLDLRADDAAYYVRRFLSHPLFATNASRMGIVARVHHQGIQFWQRNRPALQHSAWPVGS